MPEYNEGNAKYIKKQMKPVIGATITEVVFDEEFFVGIRVKDKKGKETTLWIQSDPEGNGPGWITVEKD